MELFRVVDNLIGKKRGGTEIIKFRDKKFIKDIKKGKLEVLVDWIQWRKSKLYKIAWSYLYNHQDIEDTFQDTLIKVYENIDGLKNENYFETWYITILINECRKKLKKSKREILKEDIVYEEYHLDKYQFFEELNSLDEKHREVIVLKYISGYTQDEIAKILDIPIGTVKSRIYRGLKELRSEMEEVQR